MEPADEPANYRVIGAVLAVIAALVGIGIYLVLLFRQ
jgi:preprotein translocase subunit SecF